MNATGVAATRDRRGGDALNVTIFFGLAALGAGLDLWSKQAVFSWRGLPGERDIYWLIEGYFGLETAVNTGALFGFGAGKGNLFALLSVVAGAGILVWLFRFGGVRSRWLSVALGCVTGGIIGNLYDRLGLWWSPDLPQAWQSGVRDWILWQAGPDLQWPNFNIADSLLVAGAGMLMWQSFFPSVANASAGEDETSPQPDAPQHSDSVPRQTPEPGR